VFVKICGITRAEDAAVAVDAGASAIGFIFWPKSPRFIDPYRAARIVSALPAFVTPVGVFVDQPIDYVSGVASLVKLGAVQLHGHETPVAAARIGHPIVRAIALGDGGAASQGDEWPSSVTLLLDAVDPERRGGTGRTIDWEAAAAVARRRRVLLAGGLTPENVADAVGRVRPFGVDVSSGVERAPGVKDHGRVRALFEALHAIHDNAARS
jgi:phosphoribosylanthranilate isomerase